MPVAGLALLGLAIALVTIKIVQTNENTRPTFRFGDILKPMHFGGSGKKHGYKSVCAQSTVDSVSFGTTYKSRKSALKHGELVAHCGACGACSTYHDFEVFDMLANGSDQDGAMTLIEKVLLCVFNDLGSPAEDRTKLAETCLNLALPLGPQGSNTLTEGCNSCWADNVLCTADYCGPSGSQACSCVLGIADLELKLAASPEGNHEIDELTTILAEGVCSDVANNDNDTSRRDPKKLFDIDAAKTQCFTCSQASCGDALSDCAGLDGGAKRSMVSDPIMKAVQDAMGVVSCPDESVDEWNVAAAADEDNVTPITPE
ncbi:unnamed protein product [Chrysoparadoxa australica]